MKERPVERQLRKLSSIDADVLTGTVTWSDGMRLEITFGQAPKPDAKLYVDGNPLGLKQADQVIVALARRDEEES